MSMLRKTILTTAIVGAGLASTTGAAFAGDCPTSGGHGHGEHKSHSKQHEDASGCSNAVDADNSSGAESVTGGAILGGIQTISPLNLCDNLNGNEVLSNNNFALGSIQNGDITEKSETASTAQGTDALTSAPSSTPSTSSTPIR